MSAWESKKFELESNGLIHSWKGKSAHILRPCGHIRRCTIEKLNVINGEVSVTVCFNEKGKLRRKATCPSALVATQMLWFQNNVCSSDDEDNNTCHIHPPIGPLPPLECGNVEILSSEQKRTLTWKLDIVNLLVLELIKVQARSRELEDLTTGG